MAHRAVGAMVLGAGAVIALSTQLLHSPVHATIMTTEAEPIVICAVMRERGGPRGRRGGPDGRGGPRPDDGFVPPPGTPPARDR